MNNKLIAGRFTRGMNFKRPCWLALFVSLAMMLTGFFGYYDFFPFGPTDPVSIRLMRVEDGLFLLMVAGAFGFLASLTWWFMAAFKFKFRFGGLHHQSAMAAPALTVLGLVATLLLCGGNLYAQDDNGGGPGEPPPGQPGDGGPGGPGGPGDFGGLGGPPPGDFDNGRGPTGGSAPAQFEQRMMEQTRQSLSVSNDDEWAVIQPLVQKVMDARRETSGPGAPGGPGGPERRGRPGPQASSEQQALQKAIEADAPPTEIKEALAKYRAARKEKQAKLEAAQSNLRNVLSRRQEAQAVLLGLLP